ncbi:MAG: TonB-dependent receptor [Hymenobacter sp.]|nr:MAG: TonB-dependent receptor [Hymenobacter sp.]
MKFLYNITIIVFFISLTALTHAQTTKRVKIDTTKAKKDTAIRTLKEIKITSRYYKKYKQDNASGSLKLVTPLLQLSQNIQEIDNSVITDQQATSMNESVTRNVSGAMRNNNADLYSSYIFMRGAAIGTLRNGLDLSMIYAGPSAEDAAIIGRAEFIKGPAGFINSIGDPAGSFNIVTKQPTGLSANQISFMAGSFNLYRVSADLDGSFDSRHKWQYRLNAAGQKAKSFQQYNFNDKVVVDPVLKYNITDHSYITAEYLFQTQRFQQYFATVFSPYGFASLPRDFSINDPNKAPEKSVENNGFLTYHTDLGANWQLNIKAAYARDHLEGTYFFVSRYNAANPNLILRRATYERLNTDVLAFQPYIGGRFTTGKVHHKFVAGADLNHKSFLAYSGSNDPKANQTLYPLDARNPVYGIRFDANVRSGKLSDIATNQTSISYQAAYAQDELSLLDNRLKLTVAARLTFAKSSVAKPAVSSVLNKVLTPRVGLSYALIPDFSAYTLFDQTFTPQSGLSTTGSVFAPLKGKNLEAGLKKDWAGGKWNTTLSIYHIIRDNVIVTDPATNLQSQIGQTISKGIEFDLKGEVVKGLNAIINYAYTDSHISNDANPVNVGLITPFRVKHIQNAWLNYKLPLNAIKGVNVSGSYQLQAGRAGRYPQEGDLHLAPVFRLDGGLGWSNNRFSVNGIVNNILNRFNYGSAWIAPAAVNPVGIYAYVPYPPREYRITLGCNF